MCGSGTIAVEAALIALDIAPGLKRAFGFQNLSWYDAARWQAAKLAAQRRVKPSKAAGIYARDIDTAALQHCKANLVAAGAGGAVVVERGDVLTAPPPASTGTLVSNPPYGVRIGDVDAMAAFYPKLGDAFKQRYAGWNAYLFSGDARLAKLIGLRTSKRIPLHNGALECRLYEYKMIAGSLKASRE